MRHNYKRQLYHLQFNAYNKQSITNISYRNCKQYKMFFNIIYNIFHISNSIQLTSLEIQSIVYVTPQYGKHMVGNPLRLKDAVL